MWPCANTPFPFRGSEAVGDMQGPGQRPPATKAPFRGMSRAVTPCARRALPFIKMGRGLDHLYNMILCEALQTAGATLDRRTISHYITGDEEHRDATFTRHAS